MVKEGLGMLITVVCSERIGKHGNPFSAAAAAAPAGTAVACTVTGQAEQVAASCYISCAASGWQQQPNQVAEKLKQTRTLVLHMQACQFNSSFI